MDFMKTKHVIYPTENGGFRFVKFDRELMVQPREHGEWVVYWSDSDNTQHFGDLAVAMQAATAVMDAFTAVDLPYQFIFNAIRSSELSLIGFSQWMNCVRNESYQLGKESVDNS